MGTRMDPGMVVVPATATRRRRWRLPLLACGLVLLAALALVWQRWHVAEATPNYALAEVRAGTVEDLVSALGNVQPRDYVDVGTQVSGQLRTIHVQIGDPVTQGQLLAEIDPTVYQSRVDADRAQLANLAAQLQEREARLTLARQMLERQQSLRRGNATSQEALETAEAEVRVTEAQIAALHAQIGQTQSQLRGDEANLGYTRIYAPMKGTVVSITARRGQTLNANQSAPIILRIADLAVMTVVTQVSEADVGRLRPGQPVRLATLGDPDRQYRSELRQILPTPQIVNNVVLYDVLLDVPNPEGRLMTQMTTQVFFVVEQATDVLTIPAAALRPDPDRPDGRDAGLVYLPAADGGLERRRIEVGVQTRTAVEIRSGLALGERVVVGPVAGPAAEDGARRQRPAMRARLG